MLRSVLLSLVALLMLAGSATCGSPTAPEPVLPCNIYVRTDDLGDGTRYVVWTNARGEDCNILKPPCSVYPNYAGCAK